MDSRSSALLVLALVAGCGDDPAGPVDEGTSPVAGCTGGSLASGAVFQVCFPGDWNGDVVVYAHGYVRPDLPVALPDDAVGGVPISAAVNSLGYAYATTSYRANGLVADVAVDDLEDVLEEIRRRYRPDPVRAFVVGASEGGLAAALAVEREPDSWTGGLALCGPIGDFALQIDYLGDFRAVFDYYFPGVLPGSPILSPTELQAGWESTYAPAVLEALEADPAATDQLLAVTGAPVDPLDPATVGATVTGLLWYSVFATGDAQLRLGGQPYDNSTRTYQGSGDDAGLNAGIARYAADPAARAAIDRFQTSGGLTRPLITLHTAGDPIVPAAHEGIYADKVAAAGAAALLDQQAYPRYGHCTFQPAELVAAFSRLVGGATP